MPETTVPAWLHAESLARVWRLVGEALERRGLAARGKALVRDLTREERHALSDVLGHPVTANTLRLDLTLLQDRIAARTGLGLAEVVAGLTGQALVDRAKRRRDEAARREAPFTAASAWLEHRSERLEPLAPWVEAWLADLRRVGLLTSWADGADLLLTGLALLEERGAFTGDGRPQSFVARTELAATIAGDAHALDEGTRLTALVLRAAAARAGTGPPASASERRVLWESLGVVTDRVSSTCLVWGLAGQGDRLADRVAGPMHITWWDLDEGLALASRPAVLICENPRTLEALASLGPPDLGVVCTMGRPNLVVTEVLGRLADGDARLFYHGDFDWPGVAMANAAAERFGAQPWLMGATDYLAGRGSQPLKGAPVEPLWDAELGPAMRHRGVAVHEEAALDRLMGEVFRLLD